MTASLVNIEIDTNVVESIAQTYLKTIVMPAAEPEALADEDAVEAVAGVVEPSFHLIPRLVLAIVLATVLLSALAIMTVATIAPQGFAAGS